MNPLKELAEQGQSIWLDYIRRNMLRSGELKRLVEEDGLRGVTSNPTIFDKAISGSTDYDMALRALLASDPQAPVGNLYEALAIEDIQMAADVLRPVYDATHGDDGYVSFEVSPRLAHDTERTINEAKRLRAAVDRPNVMIKVPATPAGIPAIEELIAEGVSVNVTLMFSMSHYEAVARAYIKGLERCGDPGQVASVASFFVSRVDTMVDKALEETGNPEAKGAGGKNRHRQFEGRLPALFGDLSRRRICGVAPARRAGAKAVMGEHGNEKSRLLGRALRGKSDWIGNGEYFAAGNAKRVSRSW